MIPRSGYSFSFQIFPLLRTDAAEVFGTAAAAEEWIKNSSSTWPKTNLACINPECNRKFPTVTERNGHLLIAHTMLNNDAMEEESQPFACPIASCNMHYRRKGWLTRHITQCHQASEEVSTPAPTPTTLATKNKTRIPTTTPEFKCPFVQRYCQQKKE